MPEKSSRRRSIDVHHQRFTQISESHCGPAVVQMLLHTLGIQEEQSAIAGTCEVSHNIEKHGMRVDQLACAVRQLAPQAAFWYKDHATLDDLVKLVNDHDYLVGIEWQGLFEDSLEDETADGDYGHYSVVTEADPVNRQVVIADPYKDFRSQDRIFSFEFFLTRWWDTNESIDPSTGKEHLVEDRQMLFIITPQEETFPLGLGMKKG
jgi:hypothetical protein